MSPDMPKYRPTYMSFPRVSGDEPANFAELKQLIDRGLIPAHAGKTLPDLRFYRADRSDLGKP